MSSYRVSSHPSTTCQSRPWTENKPDKKPTKVSKAPKPPSDPIFSEWAEMYKDDPLLHDTFNNAANGKFPLGFSYKDGQMIFKHRKTPKYLQFHKDSLIASRQCVEFMQNGGIFTQNPPVKKVTFEPIDADVRKKTRLRDELLRNFVHYHLRNKYEMTYEEELNALDIVQTGFILDQFIYDDIQLGESGIECHRIFKLLGLDEVYFQENRIWRVNTVLQNRRVHRRKQTKKRITKNTRIPSTSVEYMWAKHVSNIEKKNKVDDDDDESLYDA